jgi:hypothetical protein
MTNQLPENIQLVLRYGDTIERENVMAVPYEFFMSTRGRWEMLIADENVSVKAGELKLIKIKQISLPKDTLAVPCAFAQHELGVVLKIQHKGLTLIETEREISLVQFLAFSDGQISKGDLLGIINVFSIVLPKGMEPPN